MALTAILAVTLLGAEPKLALKEVVHPKFKDAKLASWPKALDVSTEAYELKPLEYQRACEAKLGRVPVPSRDTLQEERVRTRLNGKLLERNPKGQIVYADGTLVEERYLTEDLKNVRVCDNIPQGSADQECNIDRPVRLLKMRSDNPDVRWVGIARREGYNDVGVIGWNMRTGASCFFSNVSEKIDHVTRKPVTVIKRPGGDNCLECHVHSDPFLVTPYIKDAWDKLGISRKQDGFVDGEYNYHVPGIEYAGLKHHSVQLEIRGKDGAINGTCTGCHLSVVSRSSGRVSDANTAVKDALGRSTLAKHLGEKVIESARYHSKPWMPTGEIDPSDPEWRAAAAAILDYVDNKKPENVTATSPWKCDELGESMGRASDISLRRKKDGKYELRWKLKGAKGPLFDEDAIRFYVSGSLNVNLRAEKPEEAAPRWEYLEAGPIGVEPANALPPREYYSMTLDLDTEATDFKSLTFDITPATYDAQRTHCPLIRGEMTSIEIADPTKPAADGSIRITEKPEHSP